jgi:putative hydrolase of the HAD superfamily
MAILEALIVDYGDVLSGPQKFGNLEAIARRVEVSADAFRAAYRQHRDSYDVGLPGEEFWRRVLGTLGYTSEATGVLATIGWLIQEDVESWTHYRDEVWDLVRSFRTKGGRTAMLSNGVPEVMARIRSERALDLWFDVVVVSCEVDCAKPDPRIYEICLSRLGVAADRALFVDDRAVNIEAAAKLGMQTLHFTGDHSVSELRFRMYGE